jgi:hypothetical protein
MRYLRLPSLRNRWISHAGCLLLGAAICAGVWVSVDAYQVAELSQSLEGRWTVDGKLGDPNVAQVDVEYRPDGTFMAWQTGKDGSTKILEHGRWWISGRQLLQEYDSVEGRPLPQGKQQRPEVKTVIRSDQTLLLVWPAGHQIQFRRA